MTLLVRNHQTIEVFMFEWYHCHGWPKTCLQLSFGRICTQRSIFAVHSQAPRSAGLLYGTKKKCTVLAQRVPANIQHDQVKTWHIVSYNRPNKSYERRHTWASTQQCVCFLQLMSTSSLIMSLFMLNFC